ncbi:hypothetical protein E1A91_A07G206300v1 [Gossypium mustelinum]|uniref:Uncharacterized protein n=1 Tax=Gossypium mustelinum TaxID=34275 RepID=A0A5D2YNB0_GOSMU|nr:hypothetical protein E1A91_A07G206300v1 [Gossypium mustelinum]TYJ27704.1 hypothetical protein E1A91_A07G206300v1 [Gossypium mustelinum]
MGFRELCVGLMMMMILLKPISGRDAVLVLRSNATYQCNGLLGGCGIQEELESELDLLMIDSTVIRILKQGSGHISINTFIKDLDLGLISGAVAMGSPSYTFSSSSNSSSSLVS